MKLLFLLFWISIVQAKEITLQLNPGEVLSLSGYSARILLQENPQITQHRVEIRGLKEETFSSDQDFRFIQKKVVNGLQLVFQNQKFFEGRSLSEDLTTEPLQISIVGPSIPVEFYLQKGQVQIKQWKERVSTVLGDGQIVMSECSGRVRLDIRKGSVQVNNHQGPLELNTYSASAQLKNIKGSVHFLALGGGLHLENYEGVVNSRVQNGKISIFQGVGKLVFETGSGSVSIKQVQGDIEGKTQDGDVDIGYLKNNLKVISKNGRLRVDIPRSSGATVQLTTKEGFLAFNKFAENLKLTKSVESKMVRGKLKGEESGLISLTSEEGALILR